MFHLPTLVAIVLCHRTQAKCKVPRNLSSSKEFAKTFRPALHLVGAIVHGVVECYFVCHSDVAKGSSTNITLLSEILRSNPAWWQSMCSVSFCYWKLNIVRVRTQVHKLVTCKLVTCKPTPPITFNENHKNVFLCGLKM